MLLVVASANRLMRVGTVTDLTALGNCACACPVANNVGEANIGPHPPSIRTPAFDKEAVGVGANASTSACWIRLTALVPDFHAEQICMWVSTQHICTRGQLSRGQSAATQTNKQKQKQTQKQQQKQTQKQNKTQPPLPFFSLTWFNQCPLD
jgi:hypothetical protein